MFNMVLNRPPGQTHFFVLSRQSSVAFFLSLNICRFILETTMECKIHLMFTCGNWFFPSKRNETLFVLGNFKITHFGWYWKEINHTITQKKQVVISAEAVTLRCSVKCFTKYQENHLCWDLILRKCKILSAWEYLFIKTRSCHLEIFCKKSVLRNFTNFTEKVVSYCKCKTPV